MMHGLLRYDFVFVHFRNIMIMEEKSKNTRLTQYLDFVKLYTEVNKEITAKKEANKIWKERIQKEKDENLSMTDYLEQTAILRAKRNVQKLAELHTCCQYDVDHFLDLEIPIGKILTRFNLLSTVYF